jgi:hypothetical protein
MEVAARDRLSPAVVLAQLGPVGRGKVRASSGSEGFDAPTIDVVVTQANCGVLVVVGAESRHGRCAPPQSRLSGSYAISPVARRISRSTLASSDSSTDAPTGPRPTIVGTTPAA